METQKTATNGTKPPKPDAKRHEVKDIPADARQTSIAGTDVDSPAAAAAEPAPAKVVSPEQRKELREAFLAALKAQEYAQAALDAARAGKSDTVRKIVDAYGHQGPFRMGERIFKAKRNKGGADWTMSEASEATDM